MVAVVYYSPTIPSVRSTVRYAHADAVPRHADRTTLVTESEPPAAVADRYDDVIVLNGGILGNARRAKRVAEDAAADRTLFLTTFHYAPALAGALADQPWVVDVFDNPHQYAYNNPHSYHRVTARVLVRLIDRADGVVHDYHHSGPVLSDDPRFIREGFPTDLVTPSFETPDDELSCIWAGSPRLDRGMDTLVDALTTLDESVTVDVYGETDDDAVAYARRKGVDDAIVFRGRTDHEQVCEAIGEAHVGLCVLPGRPDWRHSSPLKVREYMAGGTIPLCSDFPGMRLTAESAAVYTAPEPDSLASTLARLFDIGREDPDRFVQRMRVCREHASARAMDVAGEWFVRQAVSSGLDVELF
jgi:glycosyltransferase involved in cell wall biosynthesis